MLLFAQAREAAGSASVRVEGSTVREVTSALAARYGTEMEQVVAASRIWRNGDPVAPDDEVADDDEVAVLPPVSGG